jgi:hypothetical protein
MSFVLFSLIVDQLDATSSDPFIRLCHKLFGVVDVPLQII